MFINYHCVVSYKLYLNMYFRDYKVTSEEKQWMKSRLQSHNNTSTDELNHYLYVPLNFVSTASSYTTGLPINYNANQPSKIKK